MTKKFRIAVTTDGITSWVEYPSYAAAANALRYEPSLTARIVITEPLTCRHEDAAPITFGFSKGLSYCADCGLTLDAA